MTRRTRACSPVVVTTAFHPVEERTAELIETLRATIPAVHNEQGCVLYAIHHAEDGTTTMVEKWDGLSILPVTAEPYI